MYSNNRSGRAGRHGWTGARGPGTGRMPGFRTTINYICTNQGALMDGLIPKLDRSSVFDCPNQTSTPSPPVGNKRPAVSAPDAGGVKLQPRPVGTVSGGEGQAGTGLVSWQQEENISKHHTTYKVKVDYVRKRSLDDVDAT